MNLKVYLPFLLALGLLSVVIVIDRKSFNRVEDYTAQVDRTRELINRLERLSNYLKSAQIFSPTAARVAPKSFYSLYKQETDQVPAELNQLRQLVRHDPIQRNRLNQIILLVDRHWSVLLKMNIAQIIDAGQGWRLNDLFTVHRLINQAIAYENGLLKTRQKDLAESTSLSNKLSNLFSFLALSVLLAAFLSNRASSRRRQLLEGFLESILNTSLNGIVNLQAIRGQDRVVDFKIAYANAAINDLLQLNPTDLIGKRLSTLHGFMNEPDFTSRLIDVMNRGQAKPFELRYEGSDNPIWLYVTLARLKKGLTITLQDVTPLKQYQLELQTKIEELNRSNNSLQQFNYIASHDLQEPLRKVQQFGDLLENEYGPSLGPGIDYLKRMQSAANRMSTLIKDLLSFSRISTWQKKTASISLTEVVREALLDLELLVEETRAVVDIGPLPTVEGDAVQLGQLFQNLLANALKFHQENVAPVIRINSQLVALKDVPASVRPVQQAPQYHRIDVADNGIGFDEKYLDRIFQVFQRLHSKSEFAGTGIGLAICEQVAANHGGAITAISQPGQGATFSIYLPAQTAR